MKKVSLLISIFVAILMLSVNVFAAVNAKVDMVSSKKEVKAGEEFEVAINLKDVTIADEGINDITIKIDSEKFNKESLIEVLGVAAKDGKINVNGNTLTVETYSPEVAEKYKEKAPENTVIFTKDADTSDYQVYMTFKEPIKVSEISLLTLKCKRTNTVDANSDGNDLTVSTTVRTTNNGEVGDVQKNIESKVTVADPKVAPVEENKTEDKKEEQNTQIKDNGTNNNTNNQNKPTANDVVNNNNANSTPATTNKEPIVNNNNNNNAGTNNDAGTNTPAPSVQQAQSIQTATPAQQTQATTAKTPLPAAGLKRVFFPIIAVAALVGISYKKYNDLKDVK